MINISKMSKVIVLSLGYVCLFIGDVSAQGVPAQIEFESKNLSVISELKRNGTNMVYGYDNLWVASGFKLLKINSDTLTVLEIPLPNASQKQRQITVGLGAVWVADVGRGAVFKIDPKSNEVTLEIESAMLSSIGSIAVGAGSVWVVTADNFEKMLTRYNSIDGSMEAQIELPTNGFGVLYGFDQIWVTSGMRNEVYQVDPLTNSLVATRKLGDSPRYSVAGYGSIWIHSQGNGKVQRLDPASGEVLATIDTGLPLGAASIDSGGGAIWLSTSYKVLVAQIDPSTNTLIRRFVGKRGADTIRFGAESIWVGGATIRRLKLPQ